MAGINIPGRQVAVGSNDVIVSNTGLANAILHDSQGTLDEFQRLTGVTLELTDIDMDPFGRIVISKPELAEFLKSGWADLGVDELAASNGICGVRC